MDGNLGKFLEVWKDLETVMRTKKGMEVREWEEQNVGKVDAERLKVCRIIRNYVAHNDTNDFISKVDNTTIRWVKNFTKDLKKRNKVAKKPIKTKIKEVKKTKKVVKTGKAKVVKKKK